MNDLKNRTYEGLTVADLEAELVEKESAEQSVGATPNGNYLAKVIKPFSAFNDSLKSHSGIL